MDLNGNSIVYRIINTDDPMNENHALINYYQFGYLDLRGKAKLKLIEKYIKTESSIYLN